MIFHTLVIYHWIGNKFQIDSAFPGKQNLSSLLTRRLLLTELDS